MAIINKIGDSGLLTNPLLTQFSTKPGNISTWGTGQPQTQPEPEPEPEEYSVDGGTVTATRTYWAELVAIAGAVGYALDEKRRPLYGFMVVAGIGARLVGFMGRKKDF